MDHSAKQKRKRKYCPHCSGYVSSSTFYEHKEKYFYDGHYKTIDEDTGKRLDPYNNLQGIRNPIVFSIIVLFAGHIYECYKRMKADEWKNWILIYSMYSLHDVLPSRHYNIWSLFVSACSLLVKKTISVQEVEQAHVLLKMFCNLYQNQMGKRFCTPNMHLHLHLRECLLDYGPVHAFWCFSWERFNGILGSHHTNNHNVGFQFMRKVVTTFHVQQYLKNNNLLSFIKVKTPQTLDLTETSSISRWLRYLPEITGDVFKVSGYESNTTVVDGLVNISECDYEYLSILFQKLFENSNFVRVSKVVRNIKKMNLVGQLLCPLEMNNGYQRRCCVIGRWLGPNVDLHSHEYRPGIVKNVYELKIILQTEIITMYVARMNWLQRHVKQFFFGQSNAIQIWNTEYENHTAATFIPVQLTANHFTFVQKFIRFNKLEADNVNIIIPIPSKSL